MECRMEEISQIPEIIRQLYEIVAKLEAYFPGRRFTPDGHLVGSIGEVIAAYRYGLELFPASVKAHDAKTKEGRLVQIKATQRTSVGLRSQPEHLLVLRILRNGESVEVYNGPGELAWENAGTRQKNGQRPISLAKLKELMKRVPNENRLPQQAS